ncbi:hypothetical protein [Mycolicibacterium setense]
MTTAKCQRCGYYWSFTGNPDLYQAIARWCPVCLPKALPVMGSAPIVNRGRVAS